MRWVSLWNQGTDEKVWYYQLRGRSYCRENGDSVPWWDCFCSLGLSQGVCYWIVFESWIFCNCILNQKVWGPLLCCLAFSDCSLTLLADYSWHSCKGGWAHSPPDSLPREGCLPPWHRVCRARSMLPHHLSLGLHRERAGWQTWSLAILVSPWCFWCSPEQPAAQTDQLIPASGSVGPKWLWVQAWWGVAHCKDLIRGGAERQLEGTGWLSSSIPSPAAYLMAGQGTMLLRGPWQSAKTSRLQGIPGGRASPLPGRYFSYLGLVHPRAVLLEELGGKAHLKCKGILRAIFETVLLWIKCKFHGLLLCIQVINFTW